LVNWPSEQLTEHARYLIGLHRPDRRVLRLTLWHGVLPAVSIEWQGCHFCGSREICRVSTWAHDWLGALAVRERTGAEVPP
jgi:hypothetical protein